MRDLPPPPLLIDLVCIIEIGIEDQCMRGDLSRKDENRVVLPLPSRGAKREKDKVKRNVIGRNSPKVLPYLFVLHIRPTHIHPGDIKKIIIDVIIIKYK